MFYYILKGNEVIGRITEKNKYIEIYMGFWCIFLLKLIVDFGFIIKIFFVFVVNFVYDL